MRESNVKRHEIKFVISYFDYLVYKNKFDHLLKKDEFCENSDYTITSLYYDDAFNSSLKQKIDGDTVRHKYRIRFYDNDYTMFKLEKKTKLEQVTKKTSLLLSNEEVIKILAEDVRFLNDKDSSVGKDFGRLVSSQILKPKVIVKYQRLAYIHPVGDLRITFDTSLKASFHDYDFLNSNTIYSSMQSLDKVVMEIKFNKELPSFIKSILQSSHYTQESMSKYTVSRQLNYYL